MVNYKKSSEKRTTPAWHHERSIYPTYSPRMGRVNSTALPTSLNIKK